MVSITLRIIIDVRATAQCKEKEKRAQDFHPEEFTLGTSKACQEIYIKTCNCTSLRTTQINIRQEMTGETQAVGHYTVPIRDEDRMQVSIFAGQ